MTESISEITQQRVHQLVSLLSKSRLPLDTEAALQLQVEELFRSKGIKFTREFPLDEKNRIDFMIGNVGLEIKLKGSAKTIYRQCERYCAFNEIHTLILLTGRSSGFPEELNGKPCYVVKVGRSWL